MRLVIAFSLLVLFVFAVLLLAYGIWKSIIHSRESRGKNAIDSLIGEFKFTILTDIGGKRTLINILLISTVLSMGILTLMVVSK